MSTERKPGSRGVRDLSSQERANQAPKLGTEPVPREGGKKKGSTKTASPSKSFKRKRGK